MSHSVPGPGELLLALHEQAGLDLAALMPADGGESASTFLATGRDGTVSVLKISPDAVGDSTGRLANWPGCAGGYGRRGSRSGPRQNGPFCAFV